MRRSLRAAASAAARPRRVLAAPPPPRAVSWVAAAAASTALLASLAAAAALAQRRGTSSDGGADGGADAFTAAVSASLSTLSAAASRAARALYEYYAGEGSAPARSDAEAAEAAASLEDRLRELLPPRDALEAAAVAAAVPLQSSSAVPLPGDADSSSSSSSGARARASQLLSPTVVLVMDEACVEAAYEPRHGPQLRLRPSLVRTLLALSETGCELVLASPSRSAAGAAALFSSRVLPALVSADRARHDAFQLALRRALEARYTARRGGDSAGAAEYAESWLATSTDEAEERYARAVLRVTAVLGREHTLPPPPPREGGTGSGVSGARVVRIDLLPRPLAETLLVDAVGGASAAAYPRNALVVPPAANYSSGDERSDPFQHLGELVAEYKCRCAAGAGDAADCSLPRWLDALAGAPRSGTAAAAAALQRSSAALAAAAAAARSSPGPQPND